MLITSIADGLNGAVATILVADDLGGSGVLLPLGEAHAVHLAAGELWLGCRDVRVDWVRLLDARAAIIKDSRLTGGTEVVKARRLAGPVLLEGREGRLVLFLRLGDLGSSAPDLVSLLLSALNIHIIDVLNIWRIVVQSIRRNFLPNTAQLPVGGLQAVALLDELISRQQFDR